MYYFLTFLLSTTLLGQTILQSDFSNKDWLKEFNKFKYPPWTEGMERASVATDPEIKKQVLKIYYPGKKFGNDLTGTQWPTYLDKTYEHLIVSYKVKFEKNFAFVKGGKLPGLVGGHREGHPYSNLTGGHKPNGKDGWSGRIMWRKEGRVVQYVYHPDQEGKYGDDFPWMQNGKPVKFTPGKWHTLKTEIIMNTPEKKDGIVRSWFDGNLALEKKDLRFRDIPRIGIDCLYFSTFFGGDSDDFASLKDEYAYFDDFKIESID